MGSKQVQRPWSTQSQLLAHNVCSKLGVCKASLLTMTFPLASIAQLCTFCTLLIHVGIIGAVNLFIRMSASRHHQYIHLQGMASGVDLMLRLSTQSIVYMYKGAFDLFQPLHLHKHQRQPVAYTYFQAFYFPTHSILQKG